MLTLALESSAKACSCAITRGDILLGQSFQNTGLTHSHTLLPMAEALVKGCGIAMSELEKIAVARGPGSFTGVRIGVSLAKGLAFGLEIPAVGVSTLEAMAWNGMCAPEDVIVCCVMDARRNQVYNALFSIKGGAPLRLCDDRAISLEALKAELNGRRSLLVGDGAELCAAALENAVLAPPPLRLQTAWGVAMSARYGTAGDAHGLRPAYLRPSQAERQLTN